MSDNNVGVYKFRMNGNEYTNDLNLKIVKIKTSNYENPFYITYAEIAKLYRIITGGQNEDE